MWGRTPELRVRQPERLVPICCLRPKENQNDRNIGLSVFLEPTDVTPFFGSESYESRLAASVSWQEDCKHHDEKEEGAFA